MKTLDRRLEDLEQRKRGPALYAVVDTLGKSEEQIAAEIDDAYERHPGKNVHVFIIRYDDEPNQEDN